MLNPKTNPAACVYGVGSVTTLFGVLLHQFDPVTAFILALLGYLVMRKA